MLSDFLSQDDTTVYIDKSQLQTVTTASDLAFSFAVRLSEESLENTTVVEQYNQEAVVGDELLNHNIYTARFAVEDTQRLDPEDVL